ncbi:MAG TPA: KH domain-containing protein [Thermoanaerobaculia bacterium]
MKELVDFVARSLVDHPDEVQIAQFDRDQATIFELRVAPDDLGKVIGRQGRTARAIRALLSAAGSKSGRRYILEIVE